MPHRRSVPLLLLLFLLAGPIRLAAQDDTGALVEGDTGRAVDAYLTRLVPLGFSGVALVVEDGRPVLRKGYGIADREAGTPMSTATVFSLGSITKQFTAAAILALEAQGRLSTSDSIGKYFEDVPADKRPITLHHLLTHSSGLGSDFAETDFDPAGRDRDAYVRRALDSELLFPPGQGYEYANAGYSLLAAIVEIVTGESYEEALRRLVLQPAGMTETGYRVPQWDPSRLAVGYRDGERWGTIVERWTDDAAPYWQLRGNGGLHTTLADVRAWDAALDIDAVLPAIERAKMFTPYVPEGPDSVSFYGYGWAIENTPRHGKVVQHNGGNGIFLAELHRWVDAGVTTFVFTNDPALSAAPVSRQVDAIALGDPYAEPPVVVAADPAALSRAAGAWRLPSGETLTVAADGGRLAVTPSGPEGLRLLFPLPPPARERAADLVERTRVIAAGVMARDYGPLATAFHALPIERIRTAESEILANRTARLGPPTGFEVVGAIPDEPGIAVLARYDFERGSAWNVYYWGPEGIAGVRSSSEPLSADFFPVSGSAFVAFSLRNGTGPRIEAAADGSALTIEAADSPVRASRP